MKCKNFVALTLVLNSYLISRSSIVESVCLIPIFHSADESGVSDLSESLPKDTTITTTTTEVTPPPPPQPTTVEDNSRTR